MYVHIYIYIYIYMRMHTYMYILVYVCEVTWWILLTFDWWIDWIDRLMSIGLTTILWLIIDTIDQKEKNLLPMDRYYWYWSAWSKVSGRSIANYAQLPVCLRRLAFNLKWKHEWITFYFSKKLATCIRVCISNTDPDSWVKFKMNPESENCTQNAIFLHALPSPLPHLFPSIPSF